jgi:large subunit ribosomal protein L22
MEAHAISRYQRTSAKKIGRILELIRDRDVPLALNTLRFLNKPTKMPVLKTLQSAVANAVAKAGKAKLEERDLTVSEARVGPGPSLKRWRAGARGSGDRYKHRTAHIYISVAKRETTAPAPAAEKKGS